MIQCEPMRLPALIFIFTFAFVLLFSPSVFAQGMMGTQSGISSDGHTAREEAEGKEVWEKLQAKEVTCKTLSDEDFGALGEYYMGQMTGYSHEAMNTMMVQMMGEEGEKRMHVIMGKRLSGCELSAQLPQNGVGFMPMMWMMRGGGNHMMGTGWNMMDGWDRFGPLGWLTILLFWILLILGIISLIRYIVKSGQAQERKTPLEILKERYARGEINKREFEEKKKGLV